MGLADITLLSAPRILGVGLNLELPTPITTRVLGKVVQVGPMLLPKQILWSLQGVLVV